MLITTRRTVLAGMGGLVLMNGRASAALPKLKIGILTDMSGPYKDLGGPRVEICARQAIRDFNPEQHGFSVELVSADHQNKADIGLAICGDWFDRQGVDVVMDINNSSIAFAIASMCVAKDKVQLNTGAGSSELTNSGCTPNLVHWAFDSWEQTHAICKIITDRGGSSWYFITPDYAYGHSFQDDATNFIKQAGGSVTGSVYYPFPGTADYSAYVLNAMNSKAKVLGVSTGGEDCVNLVKQAAEFGLLQSGMQIALMGAYINDVHAIGLQSAQGMLVVETFYWDLNDRTRALSRRLAPLTGTVPLNPELAGGYSGMLHYLKAVAEIGVGPAKLSGRAVVAAMKRIPIDDDAFGLGAVRADGQALHPAHLFQVKNPAESGSEWDCYKLVASTPWDQAFRPLTESKCPLVKVAPAL